MASNPTFQTCLSITHDDFPCSANRYRTHSFLRKHVPRSIVLHPQRQFKRRFTFPGNQDNKIVCKKRRRFTSVALPTKFLLGGNINDPLNLRSLEDENPPLSTPASSPMPVCQHRSQVKVMIPSNIYDPLNLSTGKDIEFNLLSSKHRKRRRHRKNRRDDSDIGLEVQDVSATSEVCELDVAVENSFSVSQPAECPENDTELEVPSSSSDERSMTDKIVSPVVPQGSPAKFFKRYHSRSFSKEAEEKTPQKPLVKKQLLDTRLQQYTAFIRFCVNSAKFCYGNRIINWDSEFFDQRLNILCKDLFCTRDVMDIGCNTGELTFFIAKEWKPNKIIGIDIDNKLINIAQRKIREWKSNEVTNDMDFPQSMATMFGSIAKFGLFSLESSAFPKNIAFLEANYVPCCEEYLDTQKPEFDVILCLRVTKWIHLNFGDDGLKMAFKRMYAQLRDGGHLILEAQPWLTYRNSKKMSREIYRNYCGIMIRPELFCKFLLSEEVGFSSCELIGRVFDPTKVYHQPIYLLTKGLQTSCRRNIQMDDFSPIPFHSDQWNHNSDEQGTSHSWSEAEFSSSYSRLDHRAIQH